ncbi:MAG: hypothetical protein OI74_09405 [Gammaproteobacteria bacterium (ex Lamellibrachia satsuma)]|nr:MAG: hypothetical protein OI74_09405 [Gammaproteobacteria bacterium (ex Lamellibrachia satsuma)]RRS36633.1 MAG: hypothetical protein NV67_06015 [Gammaproteobacteria bacterium (ex Lamellibrachia satsuma)]
MRNRPFRHLVSRDLIRMCLVLLGLLLLAVPFLTSGPDIWLEIDWIDGRKLFSIDDSYRFFAAKNAFRVPTIFLWNYVMPLALLFDAIVAALSFDNLLVMRLGHAIVGILTLVVIARASLRSGCHPILAAASVLIVGLMPLYVILSSSFYAEGLFGLLLAVAFMLLIEERNTLLAIIVGLLPLVRPEGGIYCLLFLVYFGLRRDAKQGALVALPSLIYLVVFLLLSGDGISFLGWRLELRNILSPALGQQSGPGISLDRLLNPLWCGLALSSLLIRRYRKWWPILLGPWVLIGIQALTITRGMQDFELRYLFSVIPVFGIAWALPVHYLFQAESKLRFHQSLITFLTAAIFLTTLAGHMLQSEWLRQLYDQQGSSEHNLVKGQEIERDPGQGLKRFNPKPLRAFAGRVDAYVDAHKDVQTIFVANPVPLYFLDFLENGPHIETVLIPHNANITANSDGYFFGFSLTTLSYRYFKFVPPNPAQSASAMLILNDSGYSPFTHLTFSEKNSPDISLAHSKKGIAANIQSGTMQAFAVTYSSRDSVQWLFPDP